MSLEDHAVGGSPNPAIEPLVGVQQLAELLGISARTSYRLAETGELPTLKIGSRSLFRPSEIESWLKGLN